MARYDWDYFRHKYVTGEVTLDHLASLPNSPALSTLKERSSNENWGEQRRHYLDQTRTKTREYASTTEAEVAARHGRMARALQSKALQRLQTLNIDKLDARDVLAYIKDAAELERKALGISDKVENTHRFDGVVGIDVHMPDDD